MDSSEETEIFERFFRTYKKIDLDSDLEEISERQLPKIPYDDKTKSIISAIDKVLKAKINEDLTIEDLHTLTYCAAKTVIELCQEKDLPVYDQRTIPKKFPEKEDDQKALLKLSPQRFRRLLYNKPIEVKEENRPLKEDIENYYANLWKENKYDNTLQNVYIENEEIRMQTLCKNGQVVMSEPEISTKNLSKALKMKKNWSPPGIDGIQTFWYKKFHSVREVLLKKINDIVFQKEQMPKFFTVGFTELFPKNEGTEDASNYRPITHLPSIYKIITGCIYQKIFDHYEKNGILAEEQCGGRKKYLGLKKALVMDSVALDQEPVYGYYVDFRKAFDSVHHGWILKLLQTYGIHETLVDFLRITMENWKTRIYLSPDILTKSIPLQKGIFQGDSTSVILFWTALNPLSFELKRTQLGLKLKHGGVFSHLLYMDDLKLYASSNEDLQDIFGKVEAFSAAIDIGINRKKTRNFFVPNTDENKTIYLGYIQNPKINSKATASRNVDTVKKTCEIIDNTLISETDKKQMKRNSLFSLIFKTFGVLHWEIFEEDLLMLELKEKFLKSVEEESKGLEDIYGKMFNDMCKMRRTIYNEMKKSNLMANIVQNDCKTPLKLCQKDEKEYVKALVADVKKKMRQEEKSEDEIER